MDNKITLFVVIAIIGIICLIKYRFSYNKIVKDKFQNSENITRLADTFLTDSNIDEYYYIGIRGKYLTYTNRGQIRLEPLVGNDINYDKLFIVRKGDGQNKYKFQHMYGFYLSSKVGKYYELFPRSVGGKGEEFMNKLGNDYELFGIASDRRLNVVITQRPGTQNEETYTINNVIEFQTNINKNLSFTYEFTNGEAGFMTYYLDGSTSGKLKLNSSSQNSAQFTFKKVQLTEGINNDKQIILRKRIGRDIIHELKQLIPSENIFEFERYTTNLIYVTNRTRNSSMRELSNLDIIVDDVQKTPLELVDYFPIPSHMNDSTGVAEYSDKLYFHIVSKTHGRDLYFKMKNDGMGRYHIGTTNSKSDADKFIFKRANFNSTDYYVNVLYANYENQEKPLSLDKQPYEYLRDFGTGDNPLYHNLKIYAREQDNIDIGYRSAIRHSYELLNMGRYNRIALISGYRQGHPENENKKLYIRVDGNGNVGTQNRDVSYEELHIEPVGLPVYDNDEIDIKYSICHNDNNMEQVNCMTNRSGFQHSTYSISHIYVDRNYYMPDIMNDKIINKLEISLSGNIRENNFILYSEPNYSGKYVYIGTNISQMIYNLSDLNNLANRLPSWTGGIENSINSIKFPEDNSDEYQLYIYENDRMGGDMKIIKENVSDLSSIGFSNKLSSLKFDRQEYREEKVFNKIILYSEVGYKGMSVKIPIDGEKRDFSTEDLNNLARINDTWENGTPVANRIKSILFPSILFPSELFPSENGGTLILYLRGSGGSNINLLDNDDNITIDVNSLNFETFNYITNPDREAKLNQIRNNMPGTRDCPDVCKSQNNTGELYSSSTDGRVDGLHSVNKICGGFLSGSECHDPNTNSFNLTELAQESDRLTDCRGCQRKFRQIHNGTNIFCPDLCFRAIKVDDDTNMTLYPNDRTMPTRNGVQSDGLCHNRLNLENNTCVNNNNNEIREMSYDCENCQSNDPRTEGFQNRIEPFQSYIDNVIVEIVTTEGDRLQINREYVASLFDEYLYNTNSQVYNIRGRPLIKSVRNITPDKLIGLYYNILDMPPVTRLTIKTMSPTSINLSKIEAVDENNVNVIGSGQVFIDGIDNSKLVQNTDGNASLDNIIYDLGNIATVAEQDLNLNIRFMHRKKLEKVKIVADRMASFNNLMLELYSGNTLVRIEPLNDGRAIQGSGGNKFIEIRLGSQTTIGNSVPFTRESYPYNIGKFSNRANKPNFVLGPGDQIDLETGDVNVISRNITDTNENNLGGYYGLIKTSSTPHPGGTNVNGIAVENIPDECKYFNNDQRDCENINMGDGPVNRIENGNRCRFVSKEYLQPLDASSSFTYSNERDNNFHPTIAELGLYGVHPGDSVYGNYSPSFSQNGNNDVNGLCFSTTNTRVPSNGICTGVGTSTDGNCVNITVDGTNYSRHRDARLIELNHNISDVPRSSNLRSSYNAYKVAIKIDDIVASTNRQIERENERTREQIREAKCAYCNKICDMIRYKTAPSELFGRCECSKLEEDCQGINIAEGFENEDDIIKRFESTYLNQSISVNDIGSKDLYTINMNNKCLSVYGDNDYKLVDCNENNSQQFLKKQINNRYDAKQFTGKETTPQKDVKYPYNFLQSKTNGNCLQINDEGVSIEPCNPDNYKQHWRGYTSEKICINER